MTNFKESWTKSSSLFFSTTPVLIGLLFSILTFGLSKLQNFSMDYFFLALTGLGLILIGIPHGAVDHLSNKNNHSLKSDLIKMFLMGLTWLIHPGLGLSVFIVLSAWHFGQADSTFLNSDSKYLNFYLGLATLGSLLLSQPNELISYLNMFGLKKLTYFNLTYLQYLALGLRLSLILFFFKINKNNYIALFLLITCHQILSYLPLLIAFMIYFLSIHSLNAWLRLIHKTKFTHLRLYRKTLPQTIGALILMFIIIGLKLSFNQTDHFTDQALVSFFIFVSIITAPHIFNVNQLYKN